MGSLSKGLLLNMAYLAAAILELSQDQPPQSAHDAFLGVELGHVFEVDQVDCIHVVHTEKALRLVELFLTEKLHLYGTITPPQSVWLFAAASSRGRSPNSRPIARLDVKTKLPDWKHCTFKFWILTKKLRRDANCVRSKCPSSTVAQPVMALN